MYVLVFVWCMFRLCNCFGEVPEDSIVINFDSPIYPYGDESLEWIDTSEIEVDRYNESVAFMQGDMIFKKKLDGNICMEIMLCKEGPGGSFEVVFSIDVSLCDELAKHEESQYHKILKHFGIPPDCPIEPGKYPIHQYCIDKNELGDLTSSHLGRYESRLVLTRADDCESVDKEYLYTLKIDLIVE